MRLFKIAVQYMNGFVTDIEWFPNLIKTRTTDPMGKECVPDVKPWPMMPFGYYVAAFLREVVSIEEHNWPFKALVYLTQYCYDLSDKAALRNAIVFLLAHDPDALENVKQWMADNGYDFGKFDPD